MTSWKSPSCFLIPRQACKGNVQGFASWKAMHAHACSYQGGSLRVKQGQEGDWLHRTVNDLIDPVLISMFSCSIIHIIFSLDAYHSRIRRFLEESKGVAPVKTSSVGKGKLPNNYSDNNMQF